MRHLSFVPHESESKTVEGFIDPSFHLVLVADREGARNRTDFQPSTKPQDLVLGML